MDGGCYILFVAGAVGVVVVVVVESIVGACDQCEFVVVADSVGSSYNQIEGDIVE